MRSCPDTDIDPKFLAHFRYRRSQRGEKLGESIGSASNKIFGSERQWSGL